MSNALRFGISIKKNINFIFCFLSITVIIFSCQKKTHREFYFPETGKNALYQRSLDLKSNLNVLSIALQPGLEDLAALAYFRMAKGAKVVSAYLTNGEAGESDLEAEYPPFLAEIRRQEASAALSFLDSEAHFLNMPDMTSAKDTSKVRSLWLADTLQARLKRLILRFQPNLILIAPYWTEDSDNPMLKILYFDLLKVIKKIKLPPPADRFNQEKNWQVSRIFAANHDKGNFKIVYEVRHPKWKKTYREVGAEAAQRYATLTAQRSLWLKLGEPSYALLYSADNQKIKEIDEGLSKLNTLRFRSIESKIERLADDIIQGKTKGALNKLVAIKDSINIFLLQRYMMEAAESEALFDWNSDIENLRCALLGVAAKYSISDTKLTAVQLTNLTVDEVTAIDDHGKTEIFFSGTNQGWIINEDRQQKLPLKLHEPYRLISPQNVNFNFPFGQQAIQSATEKVPYFFFIIHNAPKKESSFVYRVRIDFTFAPIFITDILNPIIRMIPGEAVHIRLTNMSRDAVVGRVKVENEIASSDEQFFRLDTKESFFADSLMINWKGNPKDSSYLIPVKIGNTPVVNFVARKFSAEFDSTKKVGLLSGLKNSSIESALVKLSINYTKVASCKNLKRLLDSLNVLIIDRRLLTLKPQIFDYKNSLDEFVTRGGHLLVFSQDAAVWNDKPLWQGMTLTPTLCCDETTPLHLSQEHPLLNSPNIIFEEDWDDWLFKRGYNIISGEILDQAQLPVKTASQHCPLIVTFANGKGKVTYVDLALEPQFLNVHPGAFRLLANLISF